MTLDLYDLRRRADEALFEHLESVVAGHSDIDTVILLLADEIARLRPSDLTAGLGTSRYQAFIRDVVDRHIGRDGPHSADAVDRTWVSAFLIGLWEMGILAPERRAGAVEGLSRLLAATFLRQA